MVDAKMDFRYIGPDGELEGYQMTRKHFLQDQLWPSWLKMQRTTAETNCIFRVGVAIWLSSPAGEQVIPEAAWIVKDGAGNLSLVAALEFETYAKVVPIPPKIITPPADGSEEDFILANRGQLEAAGINVDEALNTAANRKEAPQLSVVGPPAAAEEALASISGDTNEMCDEMMAAIRLLQEGAADEALNYLIKVMAGRTEWCNCPPGQCAGEGLAGCRVNSPLVKASG